MANKRRGFTTFEEAKKFLELQKITRPKLTIGWSIYDMKHLFPRRKNTRFFVGTDEERKRQ